MLIVSLNVKLKLLHNKLKLQHNKLKQMRLEENLKVKKSLTSTHQLFLWCSLAMVLMGIKVLVFFLTTMD